MFRFNPGIENKIFPPKAPYYKTKTKKEKDVIDRILDQKQTSRAIQANNKILSEKYNLPLGKPMSYIEANEGKENPKFKKKGGYWENCQTCTMTHLLRRRGFNIQAKPNNILYYRHQGTIYDELDRVGVEWHERFLNLDGSLPKYKTFDSWRHKNNKRINRKSLDEYLKETMKQDGIYEVYVKRKNSNITHLFCAETLGGGIHFFDPQSGKRDVYSIFNDSDISYTKILRIDNKIVNPKVGRLFLPTK